MTATSGIWVGKEFSWRFTIIFSQNLLYHFIRQVFFFKIKWLLFAIYQINISFNFDLTPYIEGE